MRFLIKDKRRKEEIGSKINFCLNHQDQSFKNAN
jgi:hypothetical protein